MGPGKKHGEVADVIYHGPRQSVVLMIKMNPTRMGDHRHKLLMALVAQQVVTCERVFYHLRLWAVVSDRCYGQTVCSGAFIIQ